MAGDSGTRRVSAKRPAPFVPASAPARQRSSLESAVDAGSPRETSSWADNTLFCTLFQETVPSFGGVGAVGFGSSPSRVFEQLVIIRGMDDLTTSSLEVAPSDRQGSARLPGIGAFPNLDDHLVEPEVTRDEMIGGRRVIALPKEVPYADLTCELSYLLSAHAAPGYRVSRDLLTRFSEDSDFASDICLRKVGLDSETGVRHLRRSPSLWFLRRTRSL